MGARKGVRMGPVLDVSEVIRVEQEVAAAGTSLLELMRRAGHAVADAARQIAPELGARIVVLAGSGNNGGDGWVTAEELAQDGYNVTLVTKAPPEELTAEPARTAALATSGFPVAVDPSKEELHALLQDANVVIDAILGTGFAHAEVRAPYDQWITLANECDAPVLAVDCPSGLNAQTGMPAATCIRANETVTMIAVKRGLTKAAARPFAGEVRLASLGVSLG